MKSFTEAQIGDHAYTYERTDGEMIGDYSWVSDLEWFDERDGIEHLTRKEWVLVAVKEVVLSDPHPLEDDDDG